MSLVRAWELDITRSFPKTRVESPPDPMCDGPAHALRSWLRPRWPPPVARAAPPRRDGDGAPAVGLCEAHYARLPNDVGVAPAQGRCSERSRAGATTARRGTAGGRSASSQQLDDQQQAQLAETPEATRQLRATWAARLAARRSVHGYVAAVEPSEPTVVMPDGTEATGTSAGEAETADDDGTGEPMYDDDETAANADATPAASTPLQAEGFVVTAQHIRIATEVLQEAGHLRVPFVVCDLRFGVWLLLMRRARLLVPYMHPIVLPSSGCVRRRRATKTQGGVPRQGLGACGLVRVRHFLFANGLFYFF